MASSTSSSPSVNRLALAALPTALEPARRLGAAIGAPDLLTKRDDLAGAALRRQQGPQARVPAGRCHRPGLRCRRHLRRRRFQSRAGHRGVREAGGTRLLRGAHGPDPDALGGEHAPLALPARHPPDRRRAAAPRPRPRRRGSRPPIPPARTSSTKFPGAAPRRSAPWASWTRAPSWRRNSQPRA